MKINAGFTRWVSIFALAAACGGAGAGAPPEAGLVWVDNESFGVDACAGADPAAEEVAAAMAGLRTRAAADLEAVLRTGAVVLGPDRFIALTPVNGSLACNGVDGQVTFRVVAVDRQAGSSLSTEIQVRGDSDASGHPVPDRLANDLARYFAGAATRSAMLR